MVRKYFIFTLFFLQISSIAFAYPSIPEESPHDFKTVIVILQENMSEDEIKKLVKEFPDLQLRFVFQHALNGFSVRGKLHSIEKLKSMYKVQSVSPVIKYKATTPRNVDIIGGNDIRGYFDHNKLRLTGKGVTVGVIDTGIDYNHPDLRRNFNGGKDLIDHDDDPMETINNGKNNTVHGTHVAGVIAANGKIRGVAPDAQIIAYRALGPGGTGTTEQIIAAIEAAIKDKVDILNLSLGNSVNGPDLPISLALNHAVEKGITAVTSNGNSGPHLWTVGSPGTASKAISVGASTPPMHIPYLKAGDMSNMRLEPLQGSLNWSLDRSYEIVDGGLGTKKELKNVKGKLVLIKRGKITFTEKAKNAHEAGAIATIIYNNTKGNFIGNLEEDVEIPVASLSKEEGERLQERLKKQQTFAATFLKEEKDYLADFSSRGPVTVSWEIKPDIVAPGVAINSTVPEGYLSLQGTSMASPHVAGAAALIKQAHPDWRPEQIKAALMHTAKPIKRMDGTPYRTFEQGAGRIRIVEAIQSETLIYPPSIQFGKFKYSGKKQRQKIYVTVENVSEKRKNYSFTIPKSTKGLYWKLPKAFTLQPNEKRKLAIELEVQPASTKEKIFDGVLILNEGINNIRIPYIYVVEEPDYPRVMGFEFEMGDGDESYRYEVYLPGGAEEFGIALFDPDHYQFLDFLDWERNVGKGLLEKQIAANQLPKEGTYLVKVFAKKAGQEDTVEQIIHIEKPIKNH